ncbi:hypothetical protein FRUB_03889 [Fimbriiglobus ruber]|uniref:Uncharacterized protein n=1 Tax=Fimbriiglobus ruber TaxID=1908690 RepID=A0A225DK23_9BACT|nr:hypothetical protein FRUB_03889 [Fimbriiglobus ruber]
MLFVVDTNGISLSGDLDMNIYYEYIKLAANASSIEEQQELCDKVRFAIKTNKSLSGKTILMQLYI